MSQNNNIFFNKKNNKLISMSDALTAIICKFNKLNLKQNNGFIKQTPLVEKFNFSDKDFVQFSGKHNKQLERLVKQSLLLALID